MGYLVYDDQTADIQIDDRTLAHLQVVMIAKLRRQESFVFSWAEPVTSGGGRSAVWVHPAVSLRFKFMGGRPPAINASWVAALMDRANSGTGLCVVPEPASASGEASARGGAPSAHMA